MLYNKIVTIEDDLRLARLMHLGLSITRSEAVRDNHVFLSILNDMRGSQIFLDGHWGIILSVALPSCVARDTVCDNRDIIICGRCLCFEV